MLKRLLAHFRSPNFIRNLLISLLVSMIASHFVVTHGENYKWVDLLSDPWYWISLLYSGSICFVLIEYIYGVSRNLSRKFAGFGLTKQWIIAQFLNGVILTICIELVLSTLIFWLNGVWIMDSAFFDKLFVPICMFIVMVNLFLMVYFLQRDPLVSLQVRYRVISNTQAKTEPNEMHDTQMPALIFVLNGQCWCLGFDSKETFWPNSLENKLATLPEDLYFQGQRNWAVHKDAIADFKNISGRRICLQIAFEYPFALEVARRRAPAFKRWLSSWSALQTDEIDDELLG